jgi:hypothetical protein
MTVEKRTKTGVRLPASATSGSRGTSAYGTRNSRAGGATGVHDALGIRSWSKWMTVSRRMKKLRRKRRVTWIWQTAFQTRIAQVEM